MTDVDGMTFDSHHGKYQGPLAALTERWVLDGDFGDDEFSDGQGSGTILFRGLHELTWKDAEYLRSDEFTMSDAELHALDHEVSMAQALVHSWDDRGFVYAWTLNTMADVEAMAASISEANEELAEAEEEAEEGNSRHEEDRQRGLTV